MNDRFALDSVAAPTSHRQRLRLDVTGRVQGVGFRPFVNRLATAEGLAGFVRNTATGATIEVEGHPDSIDRFRHRLASEVTLPARITSLATNNLVATGETTFSIRDSRDDAPGQATVLPDLVTCPECLADIRDPGNRRYGYPFATCTRCGPRYSIIESIPYDRARTTMRHFPMCPACRAEYDDPASRRFHAETICCPACGPRLSLTDVHGIPLAADATAALDQAAAAIAAGRIVAVLGLGGFQLIVDARNDAAVAKLRARKRRPAKPFAVMVQGLEVAHALAALTPAEAETLASPAGPIVLVPARPATGLAPAVAPGSPLLGLMLPTTPLHHLLLRRLARPLVCTSGNRSGAPIAADPSTALNHLGGIADVFLIHDRPVRRPIDDSVVRFFRGDATVLRHARGLAPSEFAATTTAPTLALGAQQKSALALHLTDRIVLGPHIGDLDDPDTRRALEAAAADLPRLFRAMAAVIASDLHPDYTTTRLADRLDRPRAKVPHHLAHILAGMVDCGLDRPVLGIAWDGTGYGTDGSIWGGEAITVTANSWRRFAHLLPFRLPGGEAAIRQPWRTALGALHAMDDDTGPAVAELARGARVTAAELSILHKALKRSVNAPLTTSAGRLFDAAAALLGLCLTIRYEGEAAMALEYAAARATTTHPLPPVAIVPARDAPLLLDWRPTLRALVAIAPQEAADSLARGFHVALADAIVATAIHAAIPDVVLTGGCFQNARLVDITCDRLDAAGFTPHLHRRVPPNDGGIAVGQAAFASHPRFEETR